MHPLAANDNTTGINIAEDGALPEVWEALLKAIYDRAIEDGDIDTATALEMAQLFMKGVNSGFFGNKIPKDIDYTTPDGEMIAHLRENVYQFSAAKSYQLNKELTMLLTEGEQVRTFTEWRREALKTVDTWVNDWGKTEYNTAVTGGQMASKWLGFQKHEDTMPNLKYTTVGDMRVREEHRILDGTIRPMDDPFWSEYYPPNGWNCRCSALQLGTDNDVTPEGDIVYPEIPEMFRINLAEKQLVYPPEHPYYNDISKKKLNKWVNKNLPDA